MVWDINLACCHELVLNVLPKWMSVGRQRYRAFVFTWNNYDLSVEPYLKSLECRYICYGRELAPSTGTPHLQGYVYFENARSSKSVKKLLPGAWVERARGSVDEAIGYCKKTEDFYERGDRPFSQEEKGAAEKERWEGVWKKAKDGDIEGIDPDVRVRYYGTLKRISEDYMQKCGNLSKPCGVWIYGESGSGKTRSVHEAHPECYVKPRNVWWDGYQGEEVVLLDDVDKYDVKLGGLLKHWADAFAFIGERKGGSKRIRPAKFIVTSQYRIEDIWSDKETQEALVRRFKVVEKPKGVNILF